METQDEFSPELLKQLSHVVIDGDPHRLALCSLAYGAIYRLGWLEHTSDWDPFIEITLDTGEIISSESHDADFHFGDLSLGEQQSALQHVEELTNIVVQLHPSTDFESLKQANIVVQPSNLSDQEEFEGIIPINRIKSIKYFE